MAGKNGHAPADVKAELLTQGHRFSFYQALRLLAQLGKKPIEAIRVRPDLTFGFPKADIRRIETLPDGAVQITATFLGLYGTASPLPAFYTEDLFRDRRNDSTAVRDFLDIFHRRLFVLLYESWKKYRLSLQIAEHNAAAPLTMLYAITGITGLLPGDREGDDYALIRYAGLLGAHPRSALALQTLLSDVLQGPAVEIISCIPRRVIIPKDQRLQLGRDEMPLGRNSVLGQELADRQGKFRVRIGPLSQKRFRSLLQGSPEWERLQRLVKRFLIDPLEFDFELILAKGETRQARLGGAEWSRLGLDTVLFTGTYSAELRAVYAAA